MMRHTDDLSRPIVAFDFDGTLTCKDSFTAFLTWRGGPLGFAAGLSKLGPAAARYAADRDRGALKAAAARAVLGPVSRDRLAADAEAFSDARRPMLMRPDAVACWDDWRARGARLFIVTASPEVLVGPFGRFLGAEAVIGSRLAFDDGRLAARLDGANCRGPEKVVRLRAALGDDLRLEAAYGDTDGDREMLAMAQTAGMKVFTGRP